MSIGPDDSVGGTSSNDDEDHRPEVTGVRGRIDDMTKALALIRTMVTAENARVVGGWLEDAEARIECALEDAE